jgi:hypothetical protein
MMNDGEAILTVSETTERHILMSYPQLTKDDVKALFVHGEPIERTISAYGDHRELLHLQHMQQQLRIPESMANAFDIDTVIDLVPGDDGIIYTIEEVREMSAQDKAKEKVFNLFQEYDIEYIDHNVRNDEYSISLVKKGKKEEE